MKTFKIYMILLLSLLLPINVLAEPKEYIPISKQASFTVDKLEITSLRFVDNTSLPSNNFGLVIEVQNPHNENYTLKGKISYYTKDKVLLYSSIEEYDVLSNRTSSIISMLDKRQNSKYDVDDIAFYRVDFEVLEYIAKEKDEFPLTLESCKANDYTITDYDVTIDVQKDNTYDIKEKFSVHYNEQAPVTRRIPIKNTIKNRDESTSSYHLKVLKVKQEENMSKLFKVNSGTIISIDDGAKKDTGHTYTFEYSLAKKDVSSPNHIDFSIDTDDFSSCLRGVSFKINLPEYLDANAIEFTSKTGLDKSSKVKVSQVGNAIIGEYEDILVDDTLNISIFVDDDYLVKQPSLKAFLSFFIPTVLICISLIIYFFFGRDARLGEKASDKIPDNEDLLELSLVKRGELKSSDLVLVLLSLANRGYISLKKKNKNTSNNRITYEIIKLKEYTGKSHLEKKIMRELFDESLSNVTDDILIKNYVKGQGSKKVKDISILHTDSKELAGKLSKLADDAIKDINKSSFYKIFERSSFTLAKFLKLFDYIIAVSIIVLPTLEYGTIEDALIIVALLFIIVLSFKEGIKKSKSTLTRIGSLIMIFLSILISRVTPLWETLFYERAFVYGILFGFTMLIVNYFLKELMPKKTTYGTELAGVLHSLECYLRKVEKDELKKKFADDPEYFSNLIPYLFIIGLDRQIVKSAEATKQKPPIWLTDAKTKDLYTIRRDLEIIFIDSKD